MAVTIKQIAEKSGLSIPTVSYVLNNKGHLFRAETRQRVLDVAKEMGYRPNLSARNMRSGRFNAVALLLSTLEHRSTLPSTLLDGVHDELAARGVNLTLAKLPDEKLTSTGFVPDILKFSMSDGLLINYTDHVPQTMVDLISSHEIPSVWINLEQEYDSVCPADFEAAEVATKRLISLGHKKIAFVGYVRGVDDSPNEVFHYSVIARMAGYVKAMRDAGLQQRVIQGKQNVIRAERIGFTEAWLKDENRPTAVVCYSIGEASPVAFAAKGLGLVVPRDLSMVTFSNQPEQDLGPAIATMVLPWVEVGKQAVNMLFEKMTQKEKTGHTSPLPPVQIPCRFEQGASMAPPLV